MQKQINIFKKIPINVSILLLLCTTSLYAQENEYRFNGLWANGSGGTGFKSISTSSILITSNNSNGTDTNSGYVGATLFSAATPLNN